MGERVRVPRFVGGTNMLISRQMSDERTINWYPEKTSGGGKIARGLRPAEGLRPLVNVVGMSDTVALFHEDGRMFAVVGTSFIEVFDDWTYIARGVVAYDGALGTMVSNGSAGHQVCVCTAGSVYIYNLDTDVFTLVAAFAGLYIRMVEFMDGYFFALLDESRRVYYSALEDGLTWDLTFGYIERSWGSDNIAAIKRSSRQIWLIGTLTSEVWADNGNATNPFAPIQGVFLDLGTADHFTCQRDGETVIWLSQDERGGGQIVRATGYTPEVISPYAIAAQMQLGATDFGACEAFVLQLTGHLFYWVNVPGLDTSLVFDLVEREWHERALWDDVQGVWLPHDARSHCYAFDTHVIGLGSTGVLYHLSSAYNDDQVWVPA